MDIKGDSEDAGSQQKTGCECPRLVAPQSIKSSSASPDAGGRRARRVSLSPPPRLKPCLSIACLVCDPAVCFRARRAEKTKSMEVTNWPIEFRGYSSQREQSPKSVLDEAMESPRSVFSDPLVRSAPKLAICRVFLFVCNLVLLQTRRKCIHSVKPNHTKNKN